MFVQPAFMKTLIKLLKRLKEWPLDPGKSRDCAIFILSKLETACRVQQLRRMSFARHSGQADNSHQRSRRASDHAGGAQRESIYET